MNRTLDGKVNLHKPSYADVINAMNIIYDVTVKEAGKQPAEIETKDISRNVAYSVHCLLRAFRGWEERLINDLLCNTDNEDRSYVLSLMDYVGGEVKAEDTANRAVSAI